MMIPFNPMDPWSGSVIGSKPNISVEMMPHIALTSLCEDRLTATAALTTALLLIRNQENPIWQQHLEAMSDLKGAHFHAGMTSLAKYPQYLFNLQHNITSTGMQQRTHLTAYEESATTHEIERLRHENAILAAVHIHLQSKTASYMRFTVPLVTPSMDETTPVCCSTSPRRRWRSIPMGLSTLSTTWRRRMLSLRRGRR
jgi:hypothetical protein